MRSTETSGVGAEGFGATNSAARSVANLMKQTASFIRSASTPLSPVNLVIGAIVVCAIALFVTYDASRTLAEAQRHLQLVAQAVISQIAPRDFDSAQAGLAALVAGYDAEIDAELRRNPGPASRLPVPVAIDGNKLSADMQAGSLGRLVLSRPMGSVLGGVWLRAAMLIAAGLAIIALLFRPPSRLQEANRLLSERYQDLMATIPFGVACWTQGGQMIECNRQYRERLGLPEEISGPGAGYQDALKHIVSGGYMRLVRDDDDTRLVELHREDGSCLLLEERPMAGGGFVTLVTDVSERKRADLLLNAIREEQRLLARRYHEEKLRAEAASRAKTNFLAHLSHDIRTPLNHIIGFADLIRHQTYGPLGDKRYLNYVETIKNSGERLLSSFATILDLVELDGGQKELLAEPVSVDRLIAGLAERFRPLADSAGLVLVIGAPSQAQLIGDGFALQRMLANLVENAIRFTPRGGKVMLAAFAASDGVVIEVADTGAGMSEEKLASLSQPFVFGDSALTRPDGSTGLGIAISRAIAELSGGRMAIDSAPAQGTTVAISLPLRKTEQRAAA